MSKLLRCKRLICTLDYLQSVWNTRVSSNHIFFNFLHADFFCQWFRTPVSSPANIHNGIVWITNISNSASLKSFCKNLSLANLFNLVNLLLNHHIIYYYFYNVCKKMLNPSTNSVLSQLFYNYQLIAFPLSFLHQEFPKPIICQFLSMCVFIIPMEIHIHLSPLLFDILMVRQMGMLS